MIPLPKPIPGRIAPRPKLASTIVLVRNHKGERQILMGKRSTRHDFMPSVYVFPGGRVDPADTVAKAADHMNPRTRNILESAMPPARAHACVMACIRETFEETSVVLGHPTSEPPPPIRDPSWQEIYQRGFIPNIADIHVFARAITPPFRNKRFDTWFFVTEITDNLPHQIPIASDELVDVGWFTLQQAKALDIHRATEMMLAELEIFLGYDNPPNHIFFSRVKHQRFKFSRFPE
ncbi:MAG TPA: NUDIX hydrolase [Hellea balneolensis]|uniref:NUDIX hydrolase n=1 Tax=Hellea balneolensis TaxID=287478 RepID=A0A7C5LZG8_9PROT|nr:NUDIX hydrolase [Hellea balneolensis]